MDNVTIEFKPREETLSLGWTIYAVFCLAIVFASILFLMDL